MRVLVLCLLFVTNAAAKEPFAWPKATSVKIEFKDVPAGELPAGIDFDQITVEGQEPHPVGICWLDLNRDGRPELLIHSHEGGTGGSYLHIFTRTRTGYRAVAGWQGGIILLAPAKGYYQIETWSSGGGGAFSRALLRFERGRYRCVRLEDWRAEPGADELSLAAVRSPKEYDN